MDLPAGHPMRAAASKLLLVTADDEGNEIPENEQTVLDLGSETETVPEVAEMLV